MGGEGWIKKILSVMPTCGPAGRKKPSEQEGLLTRFQASGAPSHPRV